MCSSEAHEHGKLFAAVHQAGHLVAALATGGRAGAWIREHKGEDEAFWHGDTEVLSGGDLNVIGVAGGIAENWFLNSGPYLSPDVNPPHDEEFDESDASPEHVLAAIDVLESHEAFFEWAIVTLLADGEITAARAATVYDRSLVSSGSPVAMV